MIRLKIQWIINGMHRKVLIHLFYHFEKTHLRGSNWDYAHEVLDISDTRSSCKSVTGRNIELV